MPPTQSALDLQQAFPQPGCCICRLLDRDERRYFDALVYEQVNDGGLRDVLRKTRGYCVAHVEALAATPNAPLGAAILAQDLLETLLTTLPEHVTDQPVQLWSAIRSALRTGSEFDALTNMLGGDGTCPACMHFNQFARLYVETLVSSLAEADVRGAYGHSAGLCLPHLLLAFQYGRTRAGLEELLAHQASAWGRLNHDLAEYIRKHDYRFQAEGMAPCQQDSWRRAWHMLSGLRHGHDEYDSRT